MRIAAVVALVVLSPSLALARPITAGVNAGVLHDKSDPDGEGNRTLGLFGRLGLAHRVSGQLEVMKIDTNEATYVPTTIRTATALLVFDLVDHGRLVPTIMFGAGIDRADTSDDSMEGHHFEGGFGLEYRAEGGLHVGVDLRFGGRSVNNDQIAYPATEGRIYYVPYDSLHEGEYRAMRATVGIEF